MYRIPIMCWLYRKSLYLARANVLAQVERTLKSIASRSLASKAATITKPVKDQAESEPSNDSRTSGKKSINAKESHHFGLDRIERRQLKKKLLEATETTKKDHLFKKLYPWKTRAALAQHLKESEVYNEDGLIALCKPYGIAQNTVEGRGHDGAQTVVQILNSGGVPAETPVLASVLPLLKDMYEVDYLEIVKTCERWNSGLLLLSTGSEVTEKVKKCFRRSSSMNKPAYTYQIITNGLPNLRSGTTKVAIALDYIPNIGKVPVIKKSFTTAEVKRGEAKVAYIEHSTLAHNDDLQVSFLEVSIQTRKWHCLRVWLAYAYSPVLGDRLYGGRVKTVAGKKILVSPQNLTAYQPLELSSDICRRLQLPEMGTELMPSFIHLSKIRLCQFNGKTDLELTAPLPKHFEWSCKHLGLRGGSMSGGEVKLLETEDS